jgi:protein-S-isoprenylcysteine O-methyltransferase Ste14
MLILKAVILVLATAGIVYLSRSSLLDLRSHGFYRTFAWEAIIILILLNLDDWFRDPLSWHQIISWSLLLACLFPLIAGVHSLRSIGKPDAQRNEEHLIGIEKTTRLVTTGVFKFIRHPLYCSLFLLAWGAFFKDPSLVGGGLALGATAFLLATARVEESENIRYFGAAYRAYMRQTKMFIPFLF